MTKNEFIPIFLLLVSITFTSCNRKENTADHIVMVQPNDQEINKAVEAALGELPLFWERFDHPKPSDIGFSVKVEISDANGNEYFWLTDIKHSARSVSGIIDQQPQIVKNIKQNQKVDVGIDKIIDWLFISNGKMKGNFTLRPLMKSMPKQDLDQLLPLLDQNPSIRPGA